MNQPKHRRRLSPAEVGTMIDSSLAIGVILIVVPLLFVIINSAIYHDDNDHAAILLGLGVAIIFDIVVLISIPVRLHRLRTRLREREQERMKF